MNFGVVLLHSTNVETVDWSTPSWKFESVALDAEKQRWCRIYFIHSGTTFGDKCGIQVTRSIPWLRFQLPSFLMFWFSSLVCWPSGLFYNWQPSNKLISCLILLGQYLLFADKSPGWVSPYISWEIQDWEKQSETGQSWRK